MKSMPAFLPFSAAKFGSLDIIFTRKELYHEESNIILESISSATDKLKSH
jgi:hypothetical protein